jgi:hypothetical protein
MNTLRIVSAERSGLALEGLSRTPIGLTEVVTGVFRRASESRFSDLVKRLNLLEGESVGVRGI